ncbi:MAG: sigma 54-interacting transcriptional regulator [Deltaproteobacteria bacterium]
MEDNTNMTTDEDHIPYEMLKEMGHFEDSGDYQQATEYDPLKILVVADDKKIGQNLKEMILYGKFIWDPDPKVMDLIKSCENGSFEKPKVTVVATAGEALKKIKSHDYDTLYILASLDGDVWEPDVQMIADHYRGYNVFVVTMEKPNSKEVVNAIKSGARNCLWIEGGHVYHPWTPGEIPISRQAGRNMRVATEDFDVDGIIGHSRQMRQCRKQLKRAADCDISTLLTGETGTGKTFFAMKIHELSKRNNKEFVHLNCSTFPHELFETELFGSEEGAHSKANKLKKGLIEKAEGGTLFLDEIGDMPFPQQAKLLSVLNDDGFNRVGGTKILKIDFRLISATNRPLQKAMDNGYFREDLFHRINGMSIHIPPLREHPQDIGEIMFNELMKLAYAELVSTIKLENEKKLESEKKTESEKKLESEVEEKLYPRIVSMVRLGFMDIFLEYAWPGNVRELIYRLRDSYGMAKNEGEDYMLPRHINESILQAVYDKRMNKENANSTAVLQDQNTINGKAIDILSLKDEELFTLYYKKLLETYHHEDIKFIAKKIGLAEGTFRSRLKKLGIEYERKRNRKRKNEALPLQP